MRINISNFNNYMAQQPTQVIKKWKAIDSNGPLPPQRPSKDACGTLGRSIAITTNYFPVAVGKKDLNLYQYDVTIKDHLDKENLPKKKKMLVFEKLKEKKKEVFENVPLAFDSWKSAYSTVNIKQCENRQEWKVSLRTEVSKESYKVSMVYTRQANLNYLFEAMQFTDEKQEIPTDIVQIIEVMFRHHRAKMYEQVGRNNFFNLEGDSHDIGEGKVVLKGFFGSLKPAAWKDGSILLNFDIANAAFYKAQPVKEFIKQSLDVDDKFFTRRMSDLNLKKANNILKGLKIQVTHGQRQTYKVVKVNNLGADSIEFDYNGNEVSVEKYMNLRYGIDLQYKSLNCLHVGNSLKNINMPIELCHIKKGQRVMKKLSDDEMRSFIRTTTVPPEERLRKIKDMAMRNNFGSDEMLKALSFKISDFEPLEVQGRILPPPQLTMEEKNFKPVDGVWHVSNKKFHIAGKLRTWAVINYDAKGTKGTSRVQIKKFVDMLVSMGKQKGMEILQPIDIYDSLDNPINPFDDFNYYQETHPDIQLIMCITPGRKDYSAIKKAGDIDLQIITQCLIGKTCRKESTKIVENILHKINAKMDGTNNIVTVDHQYGTGLMSFPEPFLIMGADVNHPPAGEGSMPSISAVVGSIDIHATRYGLERRMQERREEMIKDMTDITIKLLNNYYRNTGFKPNRIIMFRDGVSNSQFTQVLSFEMMAMREACKIISKDETYEPGITFICVQKRHHTRFFCDEKEGIGKSKNVPPGTIVDKDITHPTETDFYMCSHQGIQGTSRPTHYHVLWDDNDFNIDDLQMMTYKMCHVYARCSRSVSIPAPVYYAHLAAYRAKLYVSELLGGLDSDSGSSASGESALTSEMTAKIRSAVDVRFDKTDPKSLANKFHYL